ncbi:MAG: ferrochelatase [Acidobacteria bacterium]|nr:MAG: ferrochelatase [Acidobacteriota bacterium]
MNYDAILWVSFGGPEKEEDVIPFLENVLRGRNVPRERMMAVANHYYHFGGRSPINQQNRELIRALEAELAAHGPRLPVYWGNRNWHPLLTDAVAKMRADGVKRALAFATAAYSSYSSCRQYLENIENAQTAAGDGAPVIDKVRPFYNHPGYIAAMTAQVQDALEQIPPARRSAAHIVYTAHSIPLRMAENCQYAQQLLEASRLVSAALGRSGDPLVYQSRSGPPTQPWLGPDILEHLRMINNEGQVSDVAVVPIGFVSDHLEVLYDLDTEARHLSEELGMNMVRAAAVGTNPGFARLVRDLIVERMEEKSARPSMGSLGPWPDVCHAGCCLPPP